MRKEASRNYDEEVGLVAKPQTIEVIAPSALPAGYEFTVQIDGRSFAVQVPAGGVKQGQSFRATVIEQTIEPVATVVEVGDPHHIPRGRWRDGCLQCCRNGCCHPVCCLATFCSPVALGQVMTRMQLDPMAVPYTAKYKPYWSAFKVLLAVFICWLFVDRALHFALMPYENSPNSERPAGIVFLKTLRTVVRMAYGGYVWFCIWKTRGIVRERYQIPPSCTEDSCGRVEDAACAFCFPCCTVAQMSRHTADFGTYHAACCSETGLPERAPPVMADVQ